MAKKQEVTVPQEENAPAGLMTVPDYLRKDLTEVKGVDQLGEYIIPPRVKVIQRNSKSDLLELFDPAAVIANPQRVIIADVERNDSGRATEKGTPFHFVTLFFFPEWCTWNPRQIADAKMIRERTIDPNHPLVRKARDPVLRMEPYPEKPVDDKGQPIYIRHVEHLNFMIMLLNDHPLAGLPLVLSFSRGEHRAGSNLAGLIKLRKADIFGCQWEGRVGKRTNTDGEWFGIDVSNPNPKLSVSPWMAQDLLAPMEKFHEEFKEAYNKQMIRVDHEAEAQEIETEAPAATKQF